MFDVDDHLKIPDARQQARDNDIKLAISNPCFELWVLLHFQDQTASIPRNKLRAQLKKHIPQYGKLIPFEAICELYEDARARAEELNKTHQRNGIEGDNPSTDVYLLTERIKKRN